MLDEVKEYRSILIEAVADYDENLLKNSWKMKTLLQRKKSTALRAAVMDMAIIPMIAGSSFKNKGVQFMLTVCKYLPSQWIKIVLKIHPDDAELLEEDQTKILRKPDVKEPFAFSI
jgi:elongation factor G